VADAAWHERDRGADTSEPAAADDDSGHSDTAGLNMLAAVGTDTRQTRARP